MVSKSLAELARNAASGEAQGPARGLPPVHLWNPPFCGDIDLVVKSDGRWFYGGSPIQRPAMVKLFASVLKREGARYFLVTPVEKVGIQVEDVPLLVTAMQAEGAGVNAKLYFETATGDKVLAGADHPLSMRLREGEARPYIHIRSGLDALIARPVFYELAELAGPQGAGGPLGVWSDGRFFTLEAVN